MAGVAAGGAMVIAPAERVFQAKPVVLQVLPEAGLRHPHLPLEVLQHPIELDERHVRALGLPMHALLLAVLALISSWCWCPGPGPRGPEWGK